MEKELNIINFEYKKTKNTSLHFRILAFVLIFIFTFNPLYELVDFFSKTFPHSWCCQPFSCPLNSGYSYPFL